MKSHGRFRFYDVAPCSTGFRMVKMRYMVDEEAKARALEMSRQTKAELAEAYATVAEMERRESPDLPSDTLLAARAKLEALRFVFEDATTPKTHAQMLKEYAARMRKFWERKS